MNFQQVHELKIFSFFGYLHDAVVWNCSKTESGREYLENAYYYGQERPDRSKLRKIFRKQGTSSAKGGE